MSKIYFYPANILLPKKDYEKWSVIACDQYTSQPEYWEEVDRIVGETSSALRLILPEAFLSDNNKPRVDMINGNIKKYLAEEVFEEYANTFVYVERTVTDGKIRRGIVGAIDLEDYDYKKGSHALIRATEQTVIERIPPRVEIRKDAALEMPHIMLLIDDPRGTVIEPLKSKSENYKKLYDFELMKNSGHIKGYAVNPEDNGVIENSLNALIEGNEDKLLFVVGDGNHSLAAAKECYRITKNEKARYALVEIVNIHDASLEFEPIYRVVFGLNPQKVMDGFVNSLGGEYYGTDSQKFTCVFGTQEKTVSVKPSSKLCVGTLQAYLDDLLKKNKNAKIDYIHGEDVVRNLSIHENTIGFLFEGMRKDELFEAVKQDGSLPRKTFSMGGASDKRFYLESRVIQ